MNERIKELLGRAYDLAVPETWTTLSSEQLGRIYEKFALLIVRECADVGSKFSMAHPEDIRYQIKKHFGVE